MDIVRARGEEGGSGEKKTWDGEREAARTVEFSVDVVVVDRRGILGDETGSSSPGERNEKG